MHTFHIDPVFYRQTGGSIVGWEEKKNQSNFLFLFFIKFESRKKKKKKLYVGGVRDNFVNVINGRLESATAFDGCPAMVRKTTVGLGGLG